MTIRGNELFEQQRTGALSHYADGASIPREECERVHKALEERVRRIELALDSVGKKTWGILLVMLGHLFAYCISALGGCGS